jgi:hypothetical protein
MLSMWYTVRGLDVSLKDDLRNALVAHFHDVHESEVILLSNDPPTWIDLVAQLVTWKTVLAVPVAAFFKRIAERAADDVWDRTASIRRALEDKACRTLKDVSEAIRNAHQRGGADFSVSISAWATTGDAQILLGIHGDSAEDAAWYVACFIAKLDSISEFVDGHIPPGDILRPIALTLVDDGTFEITWQTRDLALHHGRIY